SRTPRAMFSKSQNNAMFLVSGVPAIVRSLAYWALRIYADRIAFVSLGSLGHGDRKRQYILNVPDTGLIPHE
ncbi:MAG: hypothetical protein ACREYF_17495, partial [Gammaproteobacteria bacterium]